MNAVTPLPVRAQPRRILVSLTPWELARLIEALEMRAGELVATGARDVAELLLERAEELREAGTTSL